MKVYLALFLPFVLAFFDPQPGRAQNADIPSSLSPSPRTLSYRWMSLSRWYQMHSEDVALATEGKSPLVFIGDSITEGWAAKGKAQWEQHFAPLGAVNFGIGGDTTQNLLWRLKFGATENLDPKAVVLLIGTNNLAQTKDQPETIAAGVVAVVDALTRFYAHADILLMGVFPRSELPDHVDRELIRRINAVISQLVQRENVTYLDISDELLEPDGRISKAIRPDYLHLSKEGYRRWAEAIEPWIKKRIRI